MLSVSLTCIPCPCYGKSALSYRSTVNICSCSSLQSSWMFCSGTRKCHRETVPCLQNRALTVHIKQSSQLHGEQGESKVSQDSFSFTKLCLNRVFERCRCFCRVKTPSYWTIKAHISQIKASWWSKEVSHFKLLCTVKLALWRCSYCMQDPIMSQAQVSWKQGMCSVCLGMSWRISKDSPSLAILRSQKPRNVDFDNFLLGRTERLPTTGHFCQHLPPSQVHPANPDGKRGTREICYIPRLLT